MSIHKFMFQDMTVTKKKVNYKKEIHELIYRSDLSEGEGDLLEKNIIKLISQALQQEKERLKKKVKKMTVTYIYDDDYNHAFVLKKDVIGLIDQPKEE